jgi:hypothetical protein
MIEAILYLIISSPPVSCPPVVDLCLLKYTFMI